MHKLLSRIFAVVAFVAVLPAVASSSPARVAGLNVPGDYIKDYTGIFSYVSGVSTVGNLVYVEPGNGGNNAMGAVLGNLWEGRLGTWGVNLRRLQPSLGQAVAFDPVNNQVSDPNLTGEAFDVMWGRKMGNGTFGLRINRSFFSDEVSTATGTVEGGGNGNRNIWGVGAGFGFAMNSNTDVEIGGLFQNRSFKDPAAGVGQPAEDDGGTTYMLSGRAFMKGGNNLMVVPVAKIYSFDLSSIDGSAPAVTTDAKLSGWQFGLAGNWTLGSDDLFVLGANFMGDKITQTVGAAPEQSQSQTYYPNVFMALETHVNSWLTARFGAQNAMMYSLKNENLAPNTTETIKDHVFTFNIGASAKVGSLALDAVLTPQFWNNPVGATFNNGLGSNPFSRVSATYSF